MTQATAWTPAEDAFVRHLVQEGKDSAEIAALCREAGIARTQKSIQRRRERCGWHARVAESPVRLTEPPTLRGDALLVGDIHAPCQDAGWINRVIDLALKWGIRKCGIGGDLVSFDAFSVFAGSTEFDVDAEIASIQQIIRTFEMCFDEVVYCAGNHEARLSRKTDWALPLETAMRLFVQGKKVVVTPAYWFNLESGGQDYYVEHQQNVSVNPALVPVKLCAKFHKHVICYHGHTCGMGRDVSGKFRGVDSGMCADPKRMEYYHMRHNTRPAMMQGAVIVRDGCEYLLQPDTIHGYESLRLAA